MGKVRTDFNVAPVTVHTTAGDFPVSGFSLSDNTVPKRIHRWWSNRLQFAALPIWVVGLEADFQGALERDSLTFTNPIDVIAFHDRALGQTVPNYDAKIEWFGTVRFRAGYVWGNGDVFSYVTGGLAYGKVDLEGTSTASGFFGSPSNSSLFPIPSVILASTPGGRWATARRASY